MRLALLTGCAFGNLGAALFWQVLWWGAWADRPRWHVLLDFNSTGEAWLDGLLIPVWVVIALAGLWAAFSLVREKRKETK